MSQSSARTAAGSVPLNAGTTSNAGSCSDEGVSRRGFLAIGLTSAAALSPGVLVSGRPSIPWSGPPAASEDYLLAPGLVYLSTATLGPCSRQVVDASLRAWYALETNPHLMGYGEGEVLASAERARQQAAQLLGCALEEVTITRSTTDGMNAIAQGMHLSTGDRVLTSDQEHEGGFMCWRYLSHRAGIAVDVVPIPPGENNTRAIIDRLSSAITPKTRVISISHVLASTGLRMPIREISTLARSRGLFCVVDGAQAVGGIEVNVKSLGCHAYATSGHKWLMAPKGTGLLYIGNDASESIQPMQLEDGRAYYSESSGVGNLPGAVGLGVAIQTLLDTGLSTVERHNLALRNLTYDGLKQLGVGRVVSPPPGPVATPLLTLELPAHADAGVLMRTLRDKHRVQVKLVPKRWLNGIRLSPHVFNTNDDVNKLISALRAELL